MVQRGCCVEKGGEIVILVLGDVGTPLMEDALVMNVKFGELRADGDVKETESS